MQRMDKILSETGVASRRELKVMFKTGRISCNGEIVRAPETKADASLDQICVDGKPIRKSSTVVLLLNKPKGYICATADPVEKTVMQLLPKEYQNLGLVPVGRLDKDTTGLLLLSNDGALTHRIISPRHAVKKVYIAKHEGCANEEDVHAFANGIILRDGTACRAALLEPIGEGESRITLCEGKYHQVRRMMASRGMHVLELTRVAECGLTIEGLPLGECRELSPEEVASLVD